MVNVRKDLTNMQFGRLKVLSRADDYIDINGKPHAQWLCECSCKEHNKIVVRGHNLLKENGTRSCGCIRKEVASKNSKLNKRYNTYQLNLQDEHGVYGIGYCSNTGNEFYFDMDDYDKIKDYCWCEHISQNGYRSVETHHIGGKKEIIRMQWIICSKYYDHEDRNPLNNRKYNLRPATRSENGQNSSVPKNNTSGIIGVHWHKGQCKWHAYIKINYKRIHLGSFNNKIDAIKTRLQAELKYFNPGFEPQRHLFDKYNIRRKDEKRDSSN